MESNITEVGGKMEKKRKMKFTKLSSKQKRLLEASALGASGVALGALGVTLMGFAPASDSDSDLEPPNAANEGSDAAEVPIYPSAPFSEEISNEMSFGDAFATAREDVGPGGFFEWKGNTYNTYYKEEWDALSDEQKNDFVSSLDESRESTEDEISDVDEILNILNDLDNDEITDLEEEDIVISDDEELDEDVVAIETDDEELDEDVEDDLEGDMNEPDDWADDPSNASF